MVRLGAAALIGLAACTPVPQQTVTSGPVEGFGPGVAYGGETLGAGPGYEDYAAYEQARLGGAPLPAGGEAISGEELSAAGLPVGGAAAVPRTPGSVSIASSSSVAAPVDLNNPGISDEQDFGAVSSRETIESDAERLARQRAAYRVIQPGALPRRSGDAGPNIVEYALSTSNAVGTQVYARGGIGAAGRFQRACARYPSSDLAQQDFLAQGGPERDRLGVDPDGDGFACYWDPAPFRAARG